MLTATRLAPFSTDPFVRLRRELDEAFEELFGRENGLGSANVYYAPLTIWEDNDHVYLEVDVPGLNQESLELTFKDDCLWISGERPVPKEDGNYWHNERMFGRFRRVVRVPETIDRSSIEAELQDGVLYITMTKKPEARATRISIRPGEGTHKRLAKEGD